MKKQLLLAIPILFLTGCGHKNTAEKHRLHVIGVRQRLDDEVVLNLHSDEYNLDYDGELNSCEIDDPISGSTSCDNCPSPPTDGTSWLDVEKDNPTGYFVNYVVFYYKKEGYRSIVVRFIVKPRMLQ